MMVSGTDSLAMDGLLAHGGMFVGQNKYDSPIF
jgi:hypothetical protein